MSARHVGGSILPSSNPEIFGQERTPAGLVQVRVIPEEDTHGLFDSATGALLAKHPNGYSCHSLAKRLRDGAAAEQANYIVACGGTVTEAGWAAIAKATGSAA